jgi:hypothetical protein
MTGSKYIICGLCIILLICFVRVTGHAQTIPRYHHNLFWGRVSLSDRITDRLKWEVYLQYRTQNDEEQPLNIFKHHQLTSYWLWLHYQATKDLRISVTPFCYFYTRQLFPQSAATGNRGVKELRWAVQAEYTQKLRRVNFSHRYSVEYRLRDLETEGVYVSNYRIRYRARFEKALTAKKHPVSLILYDEVFLEFGKALQSSPAVFNQNRLYAGFSYEIVKNIKFNLGYMYLVQERPTGAAFDNSNVLWAVLTFDNVISQFRKKESEGK